MLRYKSSRLDTKDEKYKLCAAFFKFPPKPFLLNKSQNFAHDFQSTPKNCNMLGSANLDSIIAFPIYIDNELNFQPERIIFPIQSSSSHQVPVISLSSFHTIQSKHKLFRCRCPVQTQSAGLSINLSQCPDMLKKKSFPVIQTE